MTPKGETGPTLVATSVTYCITHEATDHDDGRAWSACRFRQLFYFDNPMDEHTLMWSDDVVRPSEDISQGAEGTAPNGRSGQ